jgi:hypothetical protein
VHRRGAQAGLHARVGDGDAQIARGLAFASGPMQHATEAVTVLARRRVDVDRTAQVRLGVF